jgi:hypothetical protein
VDARDVEPRELGEDRRREDGDTGARGEQPLRLLERHLAAADDEAVAAGDVEVRGVVRLRRHQTPTLASRAP